MSTALFSGTRIRQFFRLKVKRRPRKAKGRKRGLKGIMNKIFIFVGDRRGDDLLGMAVAADGVFLASHLCSNENWVKHDMGLTSERNHDIYRRHYPDGYELEYVVHPKEHAGVQEAQRLNELPDHGAHTL